MNEPGKRVRDRWDRAETALVVIIGLGAMVPLVRWLWQALTAYAEVKP